MTIYFTSDTHFNHVNIIKYCNRPWPDPPTMTEALISNWNSVVSPGDTVYHIGDFAMGDKNLIPSIRFRLNGDITLILGNHDYNKHGKILPQIEAAGFKDIFKECMITVDGCRIYMRHEPDMQFAPSAVFDYHICGHVHQAWTRKKNILNAGMDVCGYKPISWPGLLAQPEIVGESHRGY